MLPAASSSFGRRPKSCAPPSALTTRHSPDINGDDSWELRVSPTYVIARDSRIAIAVVEIDYRRILESSAILYALKALRAG